MRRRLFNIVTVASLLLCVASGALWMRSLGHFEQISMWHARWPSADEARTLYVGFSWYSNTLRLQVIRQRFDATYFRGWPMERMAEFRRSRPPGMRWLFVGEHVTREMNGYPPGFAARRSPYGTGPVRPGEISVLAVRPWLPTLLTAALPAVWLYRYGKARSASRKGLCQSCGYDMRATPRRCPECGAVPHDAGTAARPAVS